MSADSMHPSGASPFANKSVIAVLAVVGFAAVAYIGVDAVRFVHTKIEEHENERMKIQAERESMILAEMGREARRQEIIARTPVAGGVTLDRNGAGDAEWRLMRPVGERLLADAYKLHKAVYGADVKLKPEDWAKLFEDVEGFANGTDGEFVFRRETGKGSYRAALVLVPSALKQVTIDATGLKGDAELISVAEKATGVSFAGRTKVGPFPMRKRTYAGMLDALRAGKISLPYTGANDDGVLKLSPDYRSLAKGDASVAGFTDEQIAAESDRFWREDATRTAGDLAVQAKQDSARFAPLDRDLEDGFDDAIASLEALSRALAERLVSARSFAKRCDAPWRRFADSARPARKAVRSAIGDTENLLARVDARLALAAFQRDCDTFRREEEAWWQDVGALVTVYNIQAGRKAALVQLTQEIASARNRGDGSGIDAFTAAIDSAEAARAAVAETEAAAAQKAVPFLSFPYIDSHFGEGWVRRMARTYRGTAGAAEKARAQSEEFRGKAAQYFCQSGARNRSFEKVGEIAAAFVKSVAANHAAPREGVDAASAATERELEAVAAQALQSLRRRIRRMAAGN